jgi:hypothetical protein
MVQRRPLRFLTALTLASAMILLSRPSASAIPQTRHRVKLTASNETSEDDFGVSGDT